VIIFSQINKYIDDGNNDLKPLTKTTIIITTTIRFWSKIIRKNFWPQLKVWVIMAFNPSHIVSDMALASPL
jgi:hypothetical protein